MELRIGKKGGVNMDKKQALRFLLKGASYLCLGLIVYNLFCIKGT